MSILKKIFFLSIILLVLTGLFWGVYNLSFKKDEPVKKTEDKSVLEQTDEELAELKNILDVDKTKIVPVTEEAVISPVIAAIGDNILFFTKDGGQANRTDLIGQKKESITSQKFVNLESAYWSFDRTKTILKIKDGDKYVFKYFDFASGTVTDLRENVDEIVWQHNANRIFYKYYDGEAKTRSINVSDPDGSKWQKLADIDFRNVSMAQVPKSGLISFWNTEDAFGATTLRTIPIAGGEPKMIFNDGFGADYLWDNAGERALVSRSDKKGGSKMQLGVINAIGGEYRNLETPTFASKCVWSKDNETVYCAWPVGIPENAILPNDYKEGKFNTTDTFWKIDMDGYDKKRVVEIKDIVVRFDAINLFLDQAENFLFFQNRGDGKIYRISL